jgi:hypothetical protein
MSMYQPKYQSGKKQDEENGKKNPGNPDGRAGDAGKSEQSRDQGDNQKCQCPSQHKLISFLINRVIIY